MLLASPEGFFLPFSNYISHLFSFFRLKDQPLHPSRLLACADVWIKGTSLLLAVCKCPFFFSKKTERTC